MSHVYGKTHILKTLLHWSSLLSNPTVRPQICIRTCLVATSKDCMASCVLIPVSNVERVKTVNLACERNILHTQHGLNEETKFKFALKNCKY